jgi:hypothetical protein
MKILIAICAVSLAVMHANQDLSPMYWAGLIVFIFAVILMANKLDKGYGRADKGNAGTEQPIDEKGRRA